MAYNRRKRKVKKNIPEAQAHIQCTYNNTVVSTTNVVVSTVDIISSIISTELNL